jgi:hypothetical protein
MKPGHRTLSEVARHVIVPAGITSTGWPKVRDTCRERLGIEFDGWQDSAGRLILAKRVDGKLAATVGGIGMSLPRQVGKTFVLTGLIFGLCINEPELLVVWTSHHMRTHGETFLQMQGFADRPLVRPFIKRIFVGSGDEEIRFTNGSRILFGARERGFGRGLAGVDVLMFDEAQILSERALQNMLATLNLSQLGLHVYVGTPPSAVDNCEFFTRMRVDALEGNATDTVWIECGADEDADLDDEAQWVKANPSYPHWTPRESMLRLRRKLDPDGFRREALGIWSPHNWAVFDVAAWVRLEDEHVGMPARSVLAIDVGPYRGTTTIGVAGDVNGKTVVICHSGPGTGWVATKAADLVANRDVVEVGLTPGEARGLAGDLTRLGVEFKKLTATDVAASCTAFQAAVTSGTICHAGQAELDVAVSNARTRRQGDAETWDRDFKVDISPLVACAAAFHRWAVLSSAPYDVLQSVL